MSDRDRRLRFKLWMIPLGVVLGLLVAIASSLSWGWRLGVPTGLVFGLLGVLMLAEGAAGGDHE